MAEAKTNVDAAKESTAAAESPVDKMPKLGQQYFLALVQQNIRTMLGTERGYKIITKILDIKDMEEIIQSYMEIAAEQEGSLAPKKLAATKSSAPQMVKVEQTADNSPQVTLVTVFGPQSAATKDSAHFRKYLASLQVRYPKLEEFIPVSKNGFSKAVSDELRQWADQNGIYLVPLLYDKFMFEWSPRNPHYSHHEKVSDATWQRVADERKIDKSSFPRICFDDTGVIYSTARPGDLIQATIRSETSVQSTIWRYVTKHSVMPPDM